MRKLSVVQTQFSGVLCEAVFQEGTFGATLHMKKQGAPMCGYRSLSLYATDHEEGGVADEVHGEALDELDQLGPS